MAGLDFEMDFAGRFVTMDEWNTVYLAIRGSIHWVCGVGHGPRKFLKTRLDFRRFYKFFRMPQRFF